MSSPSESASPSQPSEHAMLLNALSDMQESPAYALRRSVLELAEMVIIAQEKALVALRSAPIDMVLFCPKCGLQHIDAYEYNSDRIDPFPSFGRDPAISWDNPPHRSHLCHGCEHIWRPADVATNGVQAVKTRGKDDSPTASIAVELAAQDAEPHPCEEAAREELLEGLEGERIYLVGVGHHDAAVWIGRAIDWINDDPNDEPPSPPDTGAKP